MRKEIGKIQEVWFGKGGYQDACIGITFTLGGDGWGVGDFWGTWAMKRSSGCQWTEQDRKDTLGETCMKIVELLEKAKKDDISKLKNVPVECVFDGQLLKSWRVLTEVL
jgi:hypothetical protein